MEKKYDVTALGELLIDFAVNGESEQEISYLKHVRVEHHVMYLQC